MTTCLSDGELWALTEGSGTAEERGHVAACAPCACRMDRLLADVGVIARVLGDEPPPAPRAAPVRLPVPRLAMAAAAVALALGITFLAERQPSLIAQAADDGIAALGETSVDVFDDGDLASAATPADEVASVLAATAPCEWQAAGCRDIGQPLF